MRKPIWPGVVLGSMLTLATAVPAHAADNYVIGAAESTPHQVTFIDQRPAKELKGGLPLFFNPTYSIPDKRFTPLLTDVLGAELQARLGEHLAGKAVTLQRLQVQNYFRATYLNNQAAGFASTLTVPGLVLAAIQDRSAIDAIIYRAEGSVDGKPFTIQFAQTYKAGSCGGMVYNCGPARAATREVVIAGITQTAEAIAQALGVPPQPAPQPTPAPAAAPAP